MNQKIRILDKKLYREKYDQAYARLISEEYHVALSIFLELRQLGFTDFELLYSISECYQKMGNNEEFQKMIQLMKEKYGNQKTMEIQNIENQFLGGRINEDLCNLNIDVSTNIQKLPRDIRLAILKQCRHRQIKLDGVKFILYQYHIYIQRNCTLHYLQLTRTLFLFFSYKSTDKIYNSVKFKNISFVDQNIILCSKIIELIFNSN